MVAMSWRLNKDTHVEALPVLVLVLHLTGKQLFSCLTSKKLGLCKSHASHLLMPCLGRQLVLSFPAQHPQKAHHSNKHNMKTSIKPNERISETEVNSTNTDTKLQPKPQYGRHIHAWKLCCVAGCEQLLACSCMSGTFDDVIKVP